jgi:hypothetical protein
MPLFFTNPALLLGTLGAALPVIIHFLSRRRVRRQPFSDLRFLDEVQARQARSLGIRRWLILLLRVLAILLLALAAAGPRWGGVATGTSGQRSVLFVLDTSASMGTRGENGTRLDQALERCSEMMASLPEGAAVQVITAGSSTSALFGDWLPAGTGALQGLAAVTPSHGNFRVDRVLALAANLAARAPTAQVEMVWLSDLQPLADLPGLEAPAARLRDAALVHHLLSPVGESVAGGGVVAVEFPGRALHAGENINVRALVSTAFDDEVVVLELEGRPVAEAVVPTASASPVPVDFPLSVPAPGLYGGLIRRQSDAFPADDSRPFVLQVPEVTRVLLVHGRDRAVDPVTGRGGWRLLSAALAPAGEPGLFSVTAVGSSRLAEGDLPRHDLVVLVDPDPLGRRALAGLQEYLVSGGGVLALLGEPAQVAYYQDSLLPALGFTGEMEMPLPGLNAGQFQRPRLVDSDHPVFTGLEEEALGTLEDVRWQRWFRLAEGDARVLLQLTDDSPILLEKPQGQGLAALMPSHLSAEATNLASSSMALPFFQRLAAWLVGTRAGTPVANVPVGSTLAVSPLDGPERDDLERSEDLLVWHPGEDRARPAELAWRAGRPLLEGGVASQAGIHVFSVARDTVGLVAAGVPVAESTTTLWSPARWRQEMEGWGLELAAVLDPAQGADLASRLAGTSLAPWFFFLSLLLLLTELFLARHSGAGQASG